MTPIIESFTKNLSGCSGCGQVPQSVLEAIQKGGTVIFVLQIQVEAESVEDALQKKGSGTVISVNPKPQQSSSMSGAGTQFQRTNVQQIPKP